MLRRVKCAPSLRNMTAVQWFSSWLAMLLLTSTLALLLFFAIPTGCVVQIAGHALLLTGGAAIALLLRPRSSYDT